MAEGLSPSERARETATNLRAFADLIERVPELAPADLHGYTFEHRTSAGASAARERFEAFLTAAHSAPDVTVERQVTAREVIVTAKTPGVHLTHSVDRRLYEEGIALPTVAPLLHSAPWPSALFEAAEAKAR